MKHERLDLLVLLGGLTGPSGSVRIETPEVPDAVKPSSRTSETTPRTSLDDTPPGDEPPASPAKPKPSTPPGGGGAGEPKSGNHYDPAPTRQVANTFDADGNPVYDPTRDAKRSPVGPAMSEPTPPPVEVTGGPNESGLSMAQRAEEAERLGTAKPQTVEQLSDAEAIERGRQAVASGTDPYELVKSLSERSLPASKEQYGAILEGREQTIRDVNRAKAERDAAQASGDPSLPDRSHRPLGVGAD